MSILIRIIIKEFLQFKRDPKMFAIVLAAPVIQLILLGYAATMDLKIVRVGVLDYDRSQYSALIIDKMQGSGYFSIDYRLNNYEELRRRIDDGSIIMGIIFPHDFEKNIYRKNLAKIQTIVDGSDGNKALLASGYFGAIVSKEVRNIVVETASKAGVKINLVGSISSEARVWYNPELKSLVFMTPAIGGMLLMIVTILMTSLAVVKEKEIGTLEQIITTPIKPYQLILGKIIPFAILGFICIVIVIIILNLWFSIPVKGSVLFLLFASFLFVLSTLGLGLFVSTISKTQQQAMMLAVFGAVMPMIYLSGFAFPIENMPEIIQAITYAIPLKYYLTIIRGVILKGIGFSELLVETIILAIMGIIIISGSAARFKKRLE